MNNAGLPNWAREVLILLPACSHFLLSGNVRDQYLTAAGDSGDDRVLRPLPRLLADGFRAEGIPTTILFEISTGAETIPSESVNCAAQVLRESPVDLAPAESLDGLAELIRRVAEAPSSIALIIQSASRLVRSVSQLSDEEFEFFRRVDRIARQSRPVATDARPRFNPVVWVLDNVRDVPAWFSLHNEFLRSIVLPLPHTGEREAMAARLIPMLGSAEDEQLASAARTLTEQTAGMTLVAMQRTVAVARDQGLGPERIEDAARSYRVGVTDNPWRARYLSDRLARERLALAADADEAERPDSFLASRVLGQDVAVRKAMDILVRSSTGLTAAQASASSTKPRGVLFFAGPTGVGKTELAKALTKLLFDDERFYIRFDMSEFSAEHADQRLIGAPPGYTGYDTGGELTNAIRQRPFSLVLFDEIEKAHPRILDKFLQLLDDGRLTDGRGETVFFTEAVVVFTSNLGVYADREEENEWGIPVRRRVPTVDRAKMSYEEMAARIQAAIRDYFTTDLGRPELLNRIGDNIVVFDYIGTQTGAAILDMMLGNITQRVTREHGIDLTIPDDVRSELASVCLDESTLDLGGRGIGSRLETAFVNPLANALFSAGIPAGTRASVALTREGSEWTASLDPQ